MKKRIKVKEEEKVEKREEIKGLREKGIVVWTFGDEVVTSNEDDIILLSLVSPSFLVCLRVSGSRCCK